MNRHAMSFPISRSVTASVLAVILAFSPVVPAAHAGTESAHSLFVKGQAAESREEFDTALEFYQKAYAKSPQDLRMRTAYYRLRQTTSSAHVTKGRKLLEQKDQPGALAEFLHAQEIDPGNEAALQEIAKVRAGQPGAEPNGETSVTPEADDVASAASPAELKPVSNEPLSLHMANEDTKVIYQAIGRAAGINVLFDPDYTGKRIPVELNNVSLMDALRIVGTLSNTFWRPVTDNTIFVAQNSRPKRTELDDQAVQTFYLSNAWQQNDLNDVQTALRNVVTNAKVYAVPSQNAIVMRATPDELLLAQKVINDLDKARPEVVVDIAVMEVNKDKMRNIGLSWPGSISFALQPPTSSSSSTSTTTTTGTSSTSSSSNLTLNNLANLNANNFAITVSSATANLLLSDSDTKILQNPRIRSTDQQKATLKIGSRIPVATGSFQTGAATAITSSLVNTQFQYQDVGVNIEMTPTVHFDHDVTLKLKIEVTSQSGSVTISGVTEPIISQRTDEQVIRLREGEASILGGILEKQDLVTSSGIPGLGELPLLKYIFGSKSHEMIDDEIVFLLIPHVVRGQEISPLNLRRIDTGSGQSIELRRVMGDGGAKAPAAKPAAAKPVAEGVPPVAGQTAEGAAPAALAQMRQNADAPPPPLRPAIPAPPVPGQNFAPNPVPAAGPVPNAAPPVIPGAPATGGAHISLSPSTPAPAAGSSFTVMVNMNGVNDVASVPIQIKYDPAHMTLTNVDTGDLLGRDGQAVALVHRDDGPGLITIAASRPPGTVGVNGGGAVAVLTFQASKAGESDLVVTRPGAQDSQNRPIAVTADNLHLSVK